MLTEILLPLLIAGHAQAPSLEELKAAGSADLIKQAKEKQIMLIAGPRRGPGPDHGEDPNDEQHDPEIPGNAQRNKHLPSKDPYNGTTPHNKWAPYTPY